MAGFDRSAPAAELSVRHPRTRRFTARATVSWTVWASAGQQRMRFHTADASARGAKLRPRGPFPVGTALHLEFIKPDGQRLHVLGIVWRAETDGIAILFLGTIPTGFTELGYRG
ncbi:MAG TPA: PilZ domain-containing protein [Methylomirabilota bacterium]|nr:PilZ domain-containing protein [Methylomirabilota bacterium]